MGCVFSPQTTYGKTLISEYDNIGELVDHHAYSIIGVYNNNLIAFRNPWGEDKTSANGVHYMNIDKFYNCCSEIEISSSEPMEKRSKIGKMIEKIHTSLPGLMQSLAKIAWEYFKSTHNINNKGK